MTQERFQQLAGAMTAIAILFAALAGWSQLRFRATRAEIEALASETAELATRNRELRDAVESDAGLRENIRDSTDAIDLALVRPDGSGRATVRYDQTARRALIVIEGLLIEQSSPPAHRILVEAIGQPLLSIPIEVSASGGAEILLTDLPDRVTGFAIATASSTGFETILSGRSPSKIEDDSKSAN